MPDPVMSGDNISPAGETGDGTPYRFTPIAVATSILAIALSVGHLWMNTIGNVSTLWQNGIHFAGFTLLCALVVPAELVVNRMGLDFVTVEENGHPALRTIVPGEHHLIDGREMVEVLSGVAEGEVLLPTEPVAYSPAKTEGH